MSSTLEKFRSLSPAEFFYRNREIAGFSNPVRALYQCVRELVENSLDACDSHGILPNIVVRISRESEERSWYRVTVSDNGIGVPPGEVPMAFGQVLYGSKYRLRQTRGMFGLGAKMAILYGQITTGKPVLVETTPLRSKYKYTFKILIDIESNQPIVLEKSVKKLERKRHGTTVSLVVEGDWSRSKSRIVEYIVRTAMIAPYANLTFIPPDDSVEPLIFTRVTSKMPPPPREVKPHPHGVDIEMLKMLIAEVGADTLIDFLVKAFQSIGEKAAENFLREIGLDPKMPPYRLTIKDLEALANNLKSYKGFKAPRGRALSPLGEDIIEAGLKAVLKPEFVTAVTRSPRAYGGHPFIVEVGIAYGGEVPTSDTPILYRFANKIPLLYDESIDVTYKVVNKIDWKNYGVEFPAPLAILVHICSTKVPYKGVGKESIADVPEIEREVKNGVREAARKLKRYISRKRREFEARRRVLTFIKYIPEISRSLAKISQPIKGSGKSYSEDDVRNMFLNLLKSKYSNSPEIIEAIENFKVEIG